MRKSIQTKLLIYMLLNTLLFAALLYGSNYLFSSGYYVNQKKSTLIETSQKINELIGDSNVDTAFDAKIQLEINRLERNLGASVTIGDPSGIIYFQSYLDLQQATLDQQQNPFMIMESHNKKDQVVLQSESGDVGKVIKQWEKYNETSFFVEIEDPQFRIDTLRFQTQLDNGLTLLIWVPMAEISDSIVVSNRFTAIIGISTLFITGIWSFFISKRFTRPIKNMNKIAKDMSFLNFSQTLDVSGEDEIAQLSGTINTLSIKLSQTITELHAKNLKLEQDIDRERQLDKMRKEFISNVSHELKTPIFLIQGYAEGLKTNIDTSVQKRDFYTDVIIEESEKMDIIVRDLLDLSQMESGVFSVSKCTFDICELTQVIIQKIEPILKEKSIQLKMQLNACIEVVGDPVRIEQVIVNYINNGTNHVDHFKELEITIKKQADKIRISVYNSGSPIPADAIEKVWTSFYKVDQARTRKYGGTGLGLSIVKSIIDAHQNSYGVNNLPNGVEFWFELDCAD